MAREYYSGLIEEFIDASADAVLGVLADNNQFSLELTQKNAWKGQVELLQSILFGYAGKVYFEYSIPRMGQRIDVLLLIDGVIFANCGAKLRCLVLNTRRREACVPFQSAPLQIMVPGLVSRIIEMLAK